MTSRERVLAALAAQEVDRVPWVPLCSPRYFFSLPEYARHFPADWQGSLWPARQGSWEAELKWRVDFLRNLGADFMSWGEAGGIQADTFAMRTERYEGFEMAKRREGERMIMQVRTPLGDLRQVMGWHPEAFTGYPVEHALKGPQEWRIYEHMLQCAKIEPDYETTRRTLGIIGDDGVAFVGFPGSPVMKWLMADFTLEDLTYAMVDHPDEMASLEQEQHRFNLEICRVLAKDPARIFCNMAVLGTAMASPAVVRKHYAPYLKEYMDILRQAGKHVICHASGEPVGTILDSIRELAPFSLYGIRQHAEPNAPNMVELKQALGDQVVLAGGLDTDFIYRASPEQIRGETKRLLDAMGDKRGFIVATADDTPYGTPPQNIEAVSEAIINFG